MSVQYYYDHDSADIGITGRADCGLVTQGLEALRVAGFQEIFAEELDRVTRRSTWNENGTASEYVFDDDKERRMVAEGLRRVSAAAHSEGGLRARRHGRQARELAGRILAAEY